MEAVHIILRCLGSHANETQDGDAYGRRLLLGGVYLAQPNCVSKGENLAYLWDGDDGVVSVITFLKASSWKSCTVLRSSTGGMAPNLQVFEKSKLCCVEVCQQARQQ